MEYVDGQLHSFHFNLIFSINDDARMSYIEAVAVLLHLKWFLCKRSASISQNAWGFQGPNCETKFRQFCVFSMPIDAIWFTN